MNTHDRSKVIHAHDYRWQDVEKRDYKTEGTHFRGITRQTLLGERDDEQAPGFITRYFEIQPGGYSTLEHHDHPHSVIILRGEGEVVLQDRVAPVALHDVIYVAPGAFHQFHATGEGPLGFLCLVDRNRDRPALPDDHDLETLRENDAVAARIRT